MRWLGHKELASVLGAMLLTGIAPVHVRAQSKPAPKRAHKSVPSSAKPHTLAGEKKYAKASGKKTSAKSGKNRRREKAQKAPKPDRIQEIQAALVRQGALSGDPNGKWDAKSVEAMKKFQAANGLHPTGKLDALTLQKLGLGSDVAGRAAPRPAVSSPPAGALHLERAAPATHH